MQAHVTTCRLRIDTEGNWCTKPWDSSEHKYYPMCQYEYDPDNWELSRLCQIGSIDNIYSNKLVIIDNFVRLH